MALPSGATGYRMRGARPLGPGRPDRDSAGPAGRMAGRREPRVCEVWPAAGVQALPGGTEVGPRPRWRRRPWPRSVRSGGRYGPRSGRTGTSAGRPSPSYATPVTTAGMAHGQGGRHGRYETTRRPGGAGPQAPASAAGEGRPEPSGGLARPVQPMRPVRSTGGRGGPGRGQPTGAGAAPAPPAAGSSPGPDIRMERCSLPSAADGSRPMVRTSVARIRW